MSKDVGNLFNLEGEIAVITGAAGKLGSYYSKLLMGPLWYHMVSKL